MSPEKLEALEQGRERAETMTMRDLMRELGQLGVPHDHCETKVRLPCSSSSKDAFMC